MRKTWAKWLLVLAASTVGSAQAVVLTQGALTVGIRDDNAAINNVVFMGTEYYRLGTFVADFGFQNGTTTSSFFLFNTHGSGDGAVGPVVSSSTSATALASIPTVVGVAFTRTYTLLNGNALRIDTSVVNASGAELTLRLFDTLDPDQGAPIEFATENDVFSTVSGRAGTSTQGARSVAFVSDAPGVVIGYGGGSSPFVLGISSGSELNTFFATPYDPNGAFEDIGVGVGIQELLSIGEVFNFTYVHGFGTTAEAALNAALAALPEPSAILLLGLGLLLLGGAARVRRG